MLEQVIEEPNKFFLILIFKYLENLIDAKKVQKGLSFQSLCQDIQIQQNQLKQLDSIPYLKQIINTIRVRLNAWEMYMAYAECFSEIDNRTEQAIRMNSKINLSSTALIKEFGLIDRFADHGFHQYSPYYGCVLVGAKNALKLKALACDRYVNERDDYNLMLNNIFKSIHEAILLYGTGRSKDLAEIACIEEVVMEKAGTHFWVDLAPKHKNMIHKAFNGMTLLTQDRVLYAKAKEVVLEANKNNWEKEVLLTLKESDSLKKMGLINIGRFL